MKDINWLNQLISDTKPAAIRMAIEEGDGTLWGSVKYNDNLIVDSAPTIEELTAKMRGLLAEFHDLDPSEIVLSILTNANA